MDPLTIAAVAAPAAISAGASLWGGAQSNKMSRKEAQRNRDFQERMSNTAWQRAVADMTAAGVNPALAYSKGPATSPGGSMASQSDIVTPAVGKALESTMMRKQLQLLEAQRAKTIAEAHTAHSQQNITRYEEEWAQARRGFYFDIHGFPTGALKDLLNSEHASRLASSGKAVSDAQLSALSIPEQQAFAKLFEQMGASGKGAQLFLPLLLRMLRR